MSLMSSISFSVSDTNTRRGQKMRLVVSIIPAPGWELISQNGQDLVYERSGADAEAGSASFEIRAFTTDEKP